MNAFSNDINKCLFTAWTTASGNPNAVLSKSVECKGYAGSHVQLCYGLEPPKAQFAACYNKETLTPDFTGHIVEPDIQGAGREDEWREDEGKYGNEFYFLLTFLYQAPVALTLYSANYRKIPLSSG